MNDAAIIDLYFKRDEQALTLTEEKYGQKLRGIAFDILSDRMMAEECENDTYLRAWKRHPARQPQGAFLCLSCKDRPKTIHQPFKRRRKTEAECRSGGADGRDGALPALR